MKDSQRKAIFAKLKNGSEIVYSGKHTLLSTKLPNDRSGQGSSVGIHSLKPNERITYVVAKKDDGSMFHHWENDKGQSVSFNGQTQRQEQHELARRTSRFAFRGDYKNGLQHNKDPRDFEKFRVPDAKEKKDFKIQYDRLKKQ